MTPKMAVSSVVPDHTPNTAADETDTDLKEVAVGAIHPTNKLTILFEKLLDRVEKMEQAQKTRTVPQSRPEHTLQWLLAKEMQVTAGGVVRWDTSH